MRMEARYFGTVHGVCFRYNACGIARTYALSGFVRNERDGTVYLLVEGEDDDVRGFLKELEARMAGYISRVEYNATKSGGALGAFEIRWL